MSMASVIRRPAPEELAEFLRQFDEFLSVQRDWIEWHRARRAGGLASPEADKRAYQELARRCDVAEKSWAAFLDATAFDKPFGWPIEILEALIEIGRMTRAETHAASDSILDRSLDLDAWQAWMARLQELRLKAGEGNASICGIVARLTGEPGEGKVRSPRPARRPMLNPTTPPAEGTVLNGAPVEEVPANPPPFVPAVGAAVEARGSDLLHAVLNRLEVATADDDWMTVTGGELEGAFEIGHAIVEVVAKLAKMDGHIKDFRKIAGKLQVRPSSGESRQKILDARAKKREAKSRKKPPQTEAKRGE
jgi:hypothetical protein